MKRLTKILTATCAAVALSASLALAADAISPKNTAAATQVQCPVASTGQMGYQTMGGQKMGSQVMGNRMMNGNTMGAGRMGSGMGGMHGGGHMGMKGAGHMAMQDRSF